MAGHVCGDHKGCAATAGAEPGAGEDRRGRRLNRIYSSREARRRLSASSRMAAPSESLRRSFTYARWVLYGSVRGGAGGFSPSRPAGRPQRGQSHDSGMSASVANDGVVTWPFAQKYGMRERGAVSPRSDSPMGPAPTRVPRIALPPDIPVPPSDPDPNQQSSADDRDHPDRSDEQREPVEVLLDHTRPGQARLHPAAEQARQATPAAAVQQDEQHEQHAGDDQHDLQGQFHPIL